jgi:hypothetical protein
LTKKCMTYIGKKVSLASSTNAVGKTGYPHEED